MFLTADPRFVDHCALTHGTLAEQTPSYVEPDPNLADSLIETARDILDDRGWLVFVCTYVLDLGQIETASIVGLTQPSVCSRLQNIRRFLLWSATAPPLPSRKELDLIPKVKPVARRALYLWLRGYTSSALGRGMGVSQSAAHGWCRRAVEKARRLVDEHGRVGEVARAVVARADARRASARATMIITRDPE